MRSSLLDQGLREINADPLEEYKKYDAEILQLGKADLPRDRPSKSCSDAELENLLQKWYATLKVTKMNDPEKIHAMLKEFLNERRWRELEKEESTEWRSKAGANLAEADGLAAKGPAPGPAAAVAVPAAAPRQAPLRLGNLQNPAGRSLGAKQLAGLKPAPTKAPLPFVPTNAAIAAAAAAGGGAAGGVGTSGGRRSMATATGTCIDCGRIFPRSQLRNVAGGPDTCGKCFNSQADAIDTAAAGNATRQRKQPLVQSNLPTVPTIKVAGAAAGGARLTRGTAPVVSGNFYEPGRGGGSGSAAGVGGGGAVGAGGGWGAAPGAAQTRARRPSQPAAGTAGGAAGGDEDYAPGAGSTRAGSVARGRAAPLRRSAPPVLEDKEPIVIDSSDDEAGGSGQAGDGAAANRGGAAGPGPSSAAAAAGGVATRRSARTNGGAPTAGVDKRQDVRDLAVKLAGTKCCFPPQGGKHSVEVVADDLARLEKGEFLNDTCIDFYIKYLEHHLPEDRKQRYHFFNSFFLKKLQEKQKVQAGGPKLNAKEKVKADHERVKKWTKYVDLFSKDYIFVPIHGYLHWSLVLICHPGNIVQRREQYVPKVAQGAAAPQQRGGEPIMLHLDSLNGSHVPDTIFTALRNYLQHEWERKVEDAADEDSVPRRWAKRWRAAHAAGVEEEAQPPQVKFDKYTLPGLRMTDRLPKQDNHTDCGLFLLSYMDFFTAANPECVEKQGDNAKDVVALGPLEDAASSSTFMQKTWFRKDNTGRLRDHLRALICGLMADRMEREAGDQRPTGNPKYDAARAVHQDYKERVERGLMGDVYFGPVEYIKHIREHPAAANEAEPANSNDLLLNDTDDEGGGYEDAAQVLQTPSKPNTRAAAKQGSIKPTAAGPVQVDGAGGAAAPPGGTKRRKANPPGGAAGVDAISGPSPPVDLSSPGQGAAGAAEVEGQPQQEQQRARAPGEEVEEFSSSSDDDVVETGDQADACVPMENSDVEEEQGRGAAAVPARAPDEEGNVDTAVAAAGRGAAAKAAAEAAGADVGGNGVTDGDGAPQRKRTRRQADKTASAHASGPPAAEAAAAAQDSGRHEVDLVDEEDVDDALPLPGPVVATVAAAAPAGGPTVDDSSDASDSLPARRGRGKAEKKRRVGEAKAAAAAAALGPDGGGEAQSAAGGVGQEVGDAEHGDGQGLEDEELGWETAAEEDLVGDLQSGQPQRTRGGLLEQPPAQPRQQLHKPQGVMEPAQQPEEDSDDADPEELPGKAPRQQRPTSQEPTSGSAGADHARDGGGKQSGGGRHRDSGQDGGRGSGVEERQGGDGGGDPTGAGSARNVKTGKHYKKQKRPTPAAGDGEAAPAVGQSSSAVAPPATTAVSAAPKRRAAAEDVAAALTVPGGIGGSQGSGGSQGGGGQGSGRLGGWNAENFGCYDGGGSPGGGQAGGEAARASDADASRPHKKQALSHHPPVVHALGNRGVAAAGAGRVQQGRHEEEPRHQDHLDHRHQHKQPQGQTLQQQQQPTRQPHRNQQQPEQQRQPRTHIVYDDDNNPHPHSRLTPNANEQAREATNRLLPNGEAAAPQAEAQLGEVAAVTAGAGQAQQLQLRQHGLQGRQQQQHGSSHLHLRDHTDLHATARRCGSRSAHRARASVGGAGPESGAGGLSTGRPQTNNAPAAAAGAPGPCITKAATLDASEGFPDDMQLAAGRGSPAATGAGGPTASGGSAEAAERRHGSPPPTPLEPQAVIQARQQHMVEKGGTAWPGDEKQQQPLPCPPQQHLHQQPRKQQQWSRVPGLAGSWLDDRRPEAQEMALVWQSGLAPTAPSAAPANGVFPARHDPVSAEEGEADDDVNCNLRYDRTQGTGPGGSQGPPAAVAPAPQYQAVGQTSWPRPPPPPSQHQQQYQQQQYEQQYQQQGRRQPYQEQGPQQRQGPHQDAPHPRGPPATGGGGRHGIHSAQGHLEAALLNGITQGQPRLLTRSEERQQGSAHGRTASWAQQSAGTSQLGQQQLDAQHHAQLLQEQLLRQAEEQRLLPALAATAAAQQQLQQQNFSQQFSQLLENLAAQRPTMDLSSVPPPVPGRQGGSGSTSSASALGAGIARNCRVPDTHMLSNVTASEAAAAMAAAASLSTGGDGGGSMQRQASGEGANHNHSWGQARDQQGAPAFGPQGQRVGMRYARTPIAADGLVLAAMAQSQAASAPAQFGQSGSALAGYVPTLTRDRAQAYLAQGQGAQRTNVIQTRLQTRPLAGRNGQTHKARSSPRPTTVSNCPTLHGSITKVPKVPNFSSCNADGLPDSLQAPVQPPQQGAAPLVVPFAVPPEEEDASEEQSAAAAGPAARQRGDGAGRVEHKQRRAASQEEEQQVPAQEQEEEEQQVPAQEEEEEEADSHVQPSSSVGTVGSDAPTAEGGGGSVADGRSGDDVSGGGGAAAGGADGLARERSGDAPDAEEQAGPSQAGPSQAADGPDLHLGSGLGTQQELQQNEVEVADGGSLYTGEEEEQEEGFQESREEEDGVQEEQDVKQQELPARRRGGGGRGGQRGGAGAAHASTGADGQPTAAAVRARAQPTGGTRKRSGSRSQLPKRQVGRRQQPRRCCHARSAGSEAAAADAAAAAGVAAGPLHRADSEADQAEEPIDLAYEDDDEEGQQGDGGEGWGVEVLLAPDVGLAAAAALPGDGAAAGAGALAAGGGAAAEVVRIDDDSADEDGGGEEGSSEEEEEQQGRAGEEEDGEEEVEGAEESGSEEGEWEGGSADDNSEEESDEEEGEELSRLADRPPAHERDTRLQRRQRRQQPQQEAEVHRRPQRQRQGQLRGDAAGPIEERVGAARNTGKVGTQQTQAGNRRARASGGGDDKKVQATLTGAKLPRSGTPAGPAKQPRKRGAAAAAASNGPKGKAHPRGLSRDSKQRGAKRSGGAKQGGGKRQHLGGMEDAVDSKGLRQSFIADYPRSGKGALGGGAAEGARGRGPAQGCEDLTSE